MQIGLKRKRFILLVGDEGATLALMVGRAIRGHAYARNPGDSAEMRQLLRSARNTPVTMLLDLLEQNFREVPIPAVSPIDRGKIIARKLALTFPTAALSGATEVPGEKGPGKRFLFAAIPEMGPVTGWIEMLTECGNPVSGISLLPLEAVGLAELICRKPEPELAEAPAGDDKPRAAPAAAPADMEHWRLILSQQRASGFRQTIVHKGRMVFTRLTPGLGDGARVEDVIENIEREFASTLSYLRRLSFSDADRLELTVVAEPDVCGRLDAKQLKTRQLTCLTPTMAAQAAGVEGFPEEQLRHADLLYAGFFNQRARPTLSIDLPELKRTRLFNRLPRAAAAASLVLGLAGGGFVASTWFDISQAEHQLANDVARRAVLESQKEGLRVEVGGYAVAPDKVGAALAVHDKLVEASPAFTGWLVALGRALPPGGQVARYKLGYAGPARSLASRGFRELTREERRALPDGGEGGPELEMSFAVRLPNSRDTDAMRKAFAQVTARIEAALPGRSVQLDHDPFDVAAQAKLTGTAGLEQGHAPRDESPAFVEAEYSVRGTP